MKIEQLQQILEISKTGSISKAAQNLYTAQSNLSASLNLLEQELGSLLFERTSRGVRLTPFGTQVCQHARVICEQVDNMRALAVNSQKAELKYLNISNRFLKFVEDVFAEMYKLHSSSNTYFNMRQNPVDEIISGVSIGVSEIGVIGLCEQAKPFYLRLMAAQNIEYTMLSTELPYVVIGPYHPLFNADIDELTLKDLSDYAFITTYPEMTEFGWRYLFEGYTRKKSDVIVASRDAMLDMIYRTDGFTVGTNTGNRCCKQPAYPHVRMIPLSHKNFIIEIGWVKEKNHQLSELAQEFLSLLYDRICPE
ncbi:MAG: LysR family transcriptional regulator [Clostridiaceae bacterium]|nr:LysR family transcriptional regulator [Clostridiaceae bacterium]